MDCSSPGSSVHGIFQARIWSGLPFPSPEDLLDPGIEPASPALAGRFFTTEPPEKPLGTCNWATFQERTCKRIKHCFLKSLFFLILCLIFPVLKNGCFWTVVLEKTLERPLDCKEIKPVNSKGNQSWIFIGKTDAEAETPILWPPDSKNWLIGKDTDAGKDWRQEGK